MGHLAAVDSFDASALQKAIALGTVTASIELEDFSLNRFLTTDRSEIDARLAEFRELTTF